MKTLENASSNDILVKYKKYLKLYDKIHEFIL